MSGCGGEARDEPGGGAEEERTHDDGLRNHDDAARGERHLARWRWYGWWQHRSGCGEEEDAPVCVTATIVARLEKELNIGGSLVTVALEEACGTNRLKIREMYNKFGDLGWMIVLLVFDLFTEPSFTDMGQLPTILHGQHMEMWTLKVWTYRS